MKYKFIESNRELYGVNLLCRVMKVSRSGYHKWINQKISRRALENIRLGFRIREIFKENREVYGYRRIRIELLKKGIACNHKRVRRLMKENGLKVRQKRKYKVSTTDSKGNTRIFLNWLKTQKAELPGEILVSDITYIPTTEGWLYLAAVMDLFTREILGYAVDDYMGTKLVLRALNEAFKKVAPQRVKLFHSDRGKQYSSDEVIKTLSNFGIKQSMSRKGNCYDNAAMESFFHTLKTEWLYPLNKSTKEKTKIRIFDYIEIFYNKNRIHSALEYLSPEEFREKFELYGNVY